MRRVEAGGQRDQDAAGRLRVGVTVRAAQLRPHPRPIPLGQVLEDVAGLVDLTPLDPRGGPGADRTLRANSANAAWSRSGTWLGSMAER
jgi:hypothetical protein